MDLNDLYIKAKEKVARSDKRHSEQGDNPRVPPGQRLVEEMVAMAPIIDEHPVVSKEDWKLKIYGEVENPVELNWEEFHKLPIHKYTIDFHCVTRWSKLDQGFTGVDFKDIVDLVKPKNSAKFVIWEGYDGYTTNTVYQELKDNLAFIAVQKDGKDIEPKFGGPARAVIPHLYGWKSCKYLNGIKFVNKDEEGFWEVRGYNNHGNPWKEERYSGIF